MVELLDLVAMNAGSRCCPSTVDDDVELPRWLPRISIFSGQYTGHSSSPIVSLTDTHRHGSISGAISCGVCGPIVPVPLIDQWQTNRSIQEWQQQRSVWSQQPIKQLYSSDRGSLSTTLTGTHFLFWLTRRHLGTLSSVSQTYMHVQLKGHIDPAAVWRWVGHSRINKPLLPLALSYNPGFCAGTHAQMCK